MSIENVLFISSIFYLESSVLGLMDMSSITVRPFDVKITHTSIFYRFLSSTHLCHTKFVLSESISRNS
jgi:hypothetical protein